MSEARSQVARRYVLTGAPGSGKTSLVDELARRGYATVAEAATSVIFHELAAGRDEAWTRPGFIDAITTLQQRRQLECNASVQVFDRSPICTEALRQYLGHPPSPSLTAELGRIEDEPVYEREVFLVRDLGFIEPTAARRISYDEALHFEQVHIDCYQQFGYTLIDVPAASLSERADLVEAHLPARYP